MPDSLSCQKNINEFGPEWGGGVAFVFYVKPKGSCEMLASKGKSCAAFSGPKIPDYGTC